MKTYEEQQAFFQSHWDGLKSALESGGAPAAIAYLGDIEDDRERRILYFFARQGLVMGEWEGKNFGAYIAVTRAGIEEILRHAGAADSEEARRGITDLANMMSYNLAADIADCWPGDDTPRERQHFEAGLEAADACLRWREELDKGPGPFSMAWWAKGMHELSLGDARAASASWATSLDYAEKASSDEAGFGVVLGRGYVGLARWVAGDDEGKTIYDASVGTFREQLGDEARKDDAQFGIDQLETVRGKYAPGTE